MYQRYNRRCKRKYFLQGASSSRKKICGCGGGNGDDSDSGSGRAVPIDGCIIH